MLVHDEMRASGLPDLAKLHEIYNRSVEPSDTREPAYRHVIVACAPGSTAVLDPLPARYVTPSDTATAQTAVQAIVAAVLEQRLGGVLHSGERVALQVELDRPREHAAGLERAVADRDAHLIEVREQRDALAAALERRSQSFPTRAVRRLRRNVGSGG